MRISGLFLLLGWTAASVVAQVTPAAAQPQVGPSKKAAPAAAATSSQPDKAAAAGHRLGPEDEITVWAADIPELSANAGRALTVDLSGVVNIPMAGQINVLGLTTREVEKQVAEQLKRYIRNPQVNVTLTQMRSQPVSIVGAVNSPGIHQVHGGKTLLEVIAMAGGLRNDAGPTVTITRSLQRGPIPLPVATLDPTGNFSVAEVNLEGMMSGDHPEHNAVILPNDVVSVRRAEMVYVVGDVARAGGFVLNDKRSVSVLQALSLAGGLNGTAAPGNSKIIRGGNEAPEKRQEIAVDLKRILGGKDKDVPLYPDDILFIPDSSSKKFAVRSAEAILQTVSGILIFRGGR